MKQSCSLGDLSSSSALLEGEDPSPGALGDFAGAPPHQGNALCAFHLSSPSGVQCPNQSAEETYPEAK